MNMVTTARARGGPTSNLDMCSSAPRDVWRQLLRADPDALPSESPEWLDCICADGRYEDANLLYQTADGQQMVLPEVRRSYLPGVPSVLDSFPTVFHDLLLKSFTAGRPAARAPHAGPLPGPFARSAAQAHHQPARGIPAGFRWPDMRVVRRLPVSSCRRPTPMTLAGRCTKSLAGYSISIDLFQNATIGNACRAGCRFCHMGESGRSQGVAHFKSKIGTRPSPYAEYWERLPMRRVKHAVRQGVKRLIGFKDQDV